MLFNSYIFILVFLPVVISIYFALNACKQYKAGIIFLLLASMIFYGYNHWSYLLLLSGSIVFNYLITLLFRKTLGKSRTALVVFAVVMNVSVLFYF